MKTFVVVFPARLFFPELLLLPCHFPWGFSTYLAPL